MFYRVTFNSFIDNQVIVQADDENGAAWQARVGNYYRQLPDLPTSELPPEAIRVQQIPEDQVMSLIGTPMLPGILG
jgi:hypothetical protein